MKFILSTLVLPLLAAAAPTPNEEAKTNPPFTVMSIRSGSPIHFLTMTASGTHFYLGGKTSSYCPSEEGLVCPPGKETVLADNGNVMVCQTQLPDLIQSDMLTRTPNRMPRSPVDSKSTLVPPVR